MTESTGVRRLRDNLTDYVIRVATLGDEVVVWRRGRPIVRMRPVEAADVWPPNRRVSLIPVTQFRRHISEMLRRAMRSPFVVTWHDQPQVWVGPVIDTQAGPIVSANPHAGLPSTVGAAEEGSFGAADY